MKTVVRYGNRKLYDRETSKYVTLTELLQLPLGSFEVVTYGTNENITTETLLASLTNGNVETETKVQVLQHCIAKLTAKVTQ
jgi:polyhydroxyalkanoate synthesis regulator protein